MDLFKTIIKLLAFKLTREEMVQFNKSHFIAGLIGTWIVGMGRYWDDTGAGILQHLGVGSVIYIFALAVFIWLILKPFRVENWNYFIVVTFISLTSFPAILYAIPVERFVSLELASLMNVWFLIIVAAWRLALLYYFLKKFTRLSKRNIVTVTLMPICLIISALTVLNLHRVVFDLMAGFDNTNSHARSYSFLMFLTALSMILTLPLLIAYGYGIYKSRKKAQQ